MNSTSGGYLNIYIYILFLNNYVYTYIYIHNYELVIKIQLPEETFQFHRFGDSFQLREPAST